MSADNRIRFVLTIVFVCFYITPTHYHHCANLSEDIELIKCLSDIFVECMSKIRHILSVIHYTIRGAVFSVYSFPCNDWKNIDTLLIIIIKSGVWTITHCLGLGHETMVCAVCLFVFLQMKQNREYEYTMHKPTESNMQYHHNDPSWNVPSSQEKWPPMARRRPNRTDVGPASTQNNPPRIDGDSLTAHYVRPRNLLHYHMEPFSDSFVGKQNERERLLRGRFPMNSIFQCELRVLLNT